jgi:hypothetical protein
LLRTVQVRLRVIMNPGLSRRDAVLVPAKYRRLDRREIAYGKEMSLRT